MRQSAYDNHVKDEIQIPTTEKQASDDNEKASIQEP